MAHDVGETLLSSRSEKTEVFSPISIYGALSLLLLGSSGNTFQELLSVMGLSRGNEQSQIRRNFFSDEKTNSDFLTIDQYLVNNSWKIHEQFGFLIEDLAQNIHNDAHPRYVFASFHASNRTIK